MISDSRLIRTHGTTSRRGGPVGPSGRGQPGQAGRGGPGRGQAKQGPGAKMLDRMRQQNKPVTPQMEQLAAWMDGMDTEGADGMVRMLSLSGGSSRMDRRYV